MKAITLWQPWASLVAQGIKTEETRSWPCPPAIIGQRIAIHSAKAMKYRDACDGSFIRTAADRLIKSGMAILDLSDLPHGAVLCTAVVSRCFQVTRPGFDGVGTSDGPAYRPNIWGDFGTGRWIWVLDDVQKDKPAYCRGGQRIWNCDQIIQAESSA